MERKLTKGWTKPIIVTLKNNGTPVNLTSTTPALVLKRPDNGETVETAGDVALEDAAAGTIRWSPDATDLQVGSYTLRFKITDAEGDAFFPNDDPIALQVLPQ